MMSSLSAHKRVFAAVTALALAAGLGAGITYAAGALAAPDDPNTVVACVTTGGQIRVVAADTACRKSEDAVVLSTAVAGGQTNFTVDCTAGDRIGDVLDRVRGGTLPVGIVITGTCTEAVYIDRDNVNLTIEMGPGGSGGITAPDPGSSPVTVAGRGVGIGGLVLTGGPHGIEVVDGASLRAFRTTITGAQSGITAHQATVSLDGVSITDSAGTGLELQTGSALTASNLTVTGSGFSGVHVWNGSTANITAGSVISNNAHGGVSVENGGVANLQGAEISYNAVGGVTVGSGGHVALQGGTQVHHNQWWGVSITSGSTAAFQDDNVISDNDGNGVQISDTSLGSFQYPSDTNSITGNTQRGITCSGPVAMITALPGTVSGNGDDHVYCPVSPSP